MFFTFTHVNHREMTSFMSVSHVSDILTSSAGVQYWIPIFLCHLSRGNVIKWTSYPPICQSLRRKQVSSSERGLTLIFHNPQYYKRGETKCYLKGFVPRTVRWFLVGIWQNSNNSYYSQVWRQDLSSSPVSSYSWLELAWHGHNEPSDAPKHSSHS